MGLMRSPCCVSSSLKQLNNFYETWYELYAISGYRTNEYGVGRAIKFRALGGRH
jgi:hypothetical protein